MQKFVDYLEALSVVQAAVLLFLVPSLYAPPIAYLVYQLE
jgi:hypothetical protein